MKDIIIKVLGTAQDGGYPQPNCDCPNCINALNNKSLIRHPASIGILDTADKSSYLIDPTFRLFEQLNMLNKTAKENGFPKDHLKGILITHAHMGHYPGLLFFGKEVINSNNLLVHTSKSLKNFLNTNQPWKLLIDNENIKVKTFEFENAIELSNNLNIIPIEIPHRQELSDTAGFIIKGRNKSAFYLPDIDSWDTFTEKFNTISNEVDLLFLDGTFYSNEELMEIRGRNIKDVPHPPIKETIRKLKNGVLQKNNSQIFFTHFNHTNPILRIDYVNKVDFDEINFLKEGDLFNL
ncbi:MAG: MBL fold metallo-hydrolase [Bacillota bacterium]